MIGKCESCNKPQGVNPFCKMCKMFRMSFMESITGKEIPDNVKDQMLKGKDKK